jgi:asparagine synthase (glutamine-hydrolysing)
MSGICGLFNPDKKPVTDAELRSMTAMLERRGPERTGRWRDGPVGLGHTLLATTPELQFELQPFVHPETGCVITADVRLDNREELLRALGFTKILEYTGDAELILEAYLKWGTQCPVRLLGDFAFAIWDPRTRILFCARDHLGLRPFYYHHSAGRRFLFASDARAILVVPQVPYRIHDGRVADYLVSELEWIDYTSTFYEGIYRLPPGHRLIASQGGLDIAEYWRPVPDPEPGPMSDQDWADGLLEVLTRAVDARLRAPAGTVASMLSGGMDSGSVVAIGKDILDRRGGGPLPTISAINWGDPDCAESLAVKAAITLPGISPAMVCLDHVADSPAQLLTDIEEPFDGQMMILKGIYLAAHEHDQRVVLDGGGGDVLLSPGTYIPRLIRAGHIRLAVRESVAESLFWSMASPLPGLFRYAGSAILPALVKRTLREPKNRLRTRRIVKASLISRELAAAINIEDRFERMGQTFSAGRNDDYATERSNAIRPNVTAGRERYARIAASMATEARDPFLDRRVVDYCSRLPGRFRLKDGWPKMILRDLMADRMPDEVRWCRGKPHLGWQFNAAVTRAAVNSHEFDLQLLRKELETYVDPGALDRAWHDFRRGDDPDKFHTAYVLWVWLRDAVNRPVAQPPLFG